MVRKRNTCVSRGDMYGAFGHCSLLPHARMAGPGPYRSEHNCSTKTMCGARGTKQV